MQMNRSLILTGLLWAAPYGTLLAEEAMHQVLTPLSSTTLSGYVDTSAIWKIGKGDKLVGRSFDGADRQDGFNFNVVKLSLTKPLANEDWSAGYQLDLLAGPDAAAYKTMLGDTPTDFAIQQANVKIKAPLGRGLYGTFGVFETPFGYEKFDSYLDSQYSRSYGYSIVPRQHTGLVLAYPFTDWMTVAGGVANTCISPINGRPYRLVNGVAVPAAESEKTYVGALFLSAPKSWECLKGATLTFVAGNALNGQAMATPSHADAYYVGLTIPTPLKGFSVGGAYDYLCWQGFYAHASALYLNYQAAPKLKFGLRAEYATSKPGLWTGFVNPEDKFLGLTFTTEYDLWANVLSRLEFRWDHDLTGGRPFGNTDHNSFSLAVQLVYKF
jgi:hypothetical protein